MRETRRTAEDPLSDPLAARLLDSFTHYAVVSMDLDRRVLFWNQAATRVFGYSPDEIKGRSGDLIFTDEDRRAGAPEVESETALRDGWVEDDRWHQRKDASRFWATGEMSAIRDADGKTAGFVKVVRDRTEMKRLQDSLRERNRLVSLANLIVWNMDGRITLWSKGAARDFGYLAEQAIGSVVHDLLKTEFPTSLLEVRQAVLQTGFWEGELIHRTKAGQRLTFSSRWVLHRDESGAPIAILEVNSDITARKRAEEERALALSRLERLLANSPVGIGFMDAELRYVVVNEALADLNGVSREAHIGRHLRDVLPQAADGLEPLLRSILETRKPALNMEITAPGAPNAAEQRHFIASYFPVDLPDGTIAGVGAVVWEITARKIAEQRLEQSNRDLEHFAYSVSHDLQGPLRTMASFASLAAANVESGETAKVRENLNRIVATARRMFRLVQDLLTYSQANRVEAALGQNVDLNEIVGHVLADLDSVIRETGVQIAVRSLPIVRGDPARLHQLMQNLVSNAIKYRGEAPPRVSISAERLGDRWQVDVQDNGIGIPASEKERIFGVFTRLHGRDRYEGTGLGLAICRRIVETHGGRIWLDSEPGRGSTFHFTLPAHESTA